MNRLHWQCKHRSMREMDVVLGNFFDNRLSLLNAEQMAAFVELVDMHDIELWPLIVGRQKCANPVQEEVVALLRDAKVTG